MQIPTSQSTLWVKYVPFDIDSSDTDFRVKGDLFCDFGGVADEDVPEEEVHGGFEGFVEADERDGLGGLAEGVLGDGAGADDFLWG